MRVLGGTKRFQRRFSGFKGVSGSLRWLLVVSAAFQGVSEALKGIPRGFKVLWDASRAFQGLSRALQKVSGAFQKFLGAPEGFRVTVGSIRGARGVSGIPGVLTSQKRFRRTAALQRQLRPTLAKSRIVPSSFHVFWCQPNQS